MPAFANALGGVLCQSHNGQERVICYWSRQLSKAERNYSTIEREALAAVAAIKEFYPYLYGFSFTLITDHNPLTALKGLKDVGGQLARWMIFLQQFQMKIEYKPGKAHTDADALSRTPLSGGEGRGGHDDDGVGSNRSEGRGGHGDERVGSSGGEGRADLLTVPGFPGLSRKLSCPGVPETYRMSRVPISVYDIHTRNATALVERRQPYAVLRNLQNFQLILPLNFNKPYRFAR